MEIEYKELPSRNHRFTDAMCLKNLLYVLALESEGGSIRRKQVNDILAKHDGLRAILTLNGFPISTLVKIIRLVRICDDEALRDTLCYKDWENERVESSEHVWDPRGVERLVLENAAFREGIVNLFYEGGSLSVLHHNFNSSEIKRLSSMRMSFKPHALIETLVEYALYYEHAESVGVALAKLGKQLGS